MPKRTCTIAGCDLPVWGHGYCNNHCRRFRLPPMTALDCTCPHEERNLGRLYGISMGKGTVRLRDEPGCPVHDPRTHDFTPAETKPWSVPPPLCVRCSIPKHRHGKANA